MLAVHTEVANSIIFQNMDILFIVTDSKGGINPYEGL